MPLADLTEDERRIVRECLACVAAGDVILHDAEFETTMGVDVNTLRSVLDAWPAVDDSQDPVRIAINNSLNNLLGYPHAFHAEWDARISVPKADVERVFSRWLGEDVGS
jgi:hypothetical protein